MPPVIADKTAEDASPIKTFLALSVIILANLKFIWHYSNEIVSG